MTWSNQWSKEFEADCNSTALVEGEDPRITVGRMDFEVSSLISETEDRV